MVVCQMSVAAAPFARQDRRAAVYFWPAEQAATTGSGRGRIEPHSAGVTAHQFCLAPFSGGRDFEEGGGGDMGEGEYGVRVSVEICAYEYSVQALPDRLSVSISPNQNTFLLVISRYEPV